MNNSMHKGELETFWYFDINGNNKVESTKAFFEDLRKSGFPTK